VAQQVEVTDGIQHLVLDELVLVAQAVLIEDTVVIHHNGVVHTAALGQALGAQILDLVHKAKGAGAAHLLDKGSAGEIHGGFQRPAMKNRVIKLDRESNLETVERNKTGGF